MSFTRIGLCALALAVPGTMSRTPDFAFTTRGGISITTSGEARYGLVEATREMPRFFSLTLGTTGEAGAITFTRLADEVPMAGKYTISPWGKPAVNGTGFQALFVAGTAADPKGVFWGESGTLTIRSTRPGIIEGTFVLKARGFLAKNPENETVGVTVHGTFTARGGQMVAMVTEVR